MELADGADPTESEEPAVLKEEELRIELAKISFHAILEKSAGATMRLQGTLASRSVLILVDSGSTHNFFAASLVNELRLPIQEIPSFSVQIGNGDVIQCTKICKGISVQLSRLQITQESRLLSLLLQGADLVLGIKWLRGVYDFLPQRETLQAARCPISISSICFFPIIFDAHQLAL